MDLPDHAVQLFGDAARRPLEHDDPEPEAARVRFLLDPDHTVHEHREHKRNVGEWTRLGRDAYHTLVYTIIRPPRMLYSGTMLGPQQHRVGGRDVTRRDFELHNGRGMTLPASEWTPSGGDDGGPLVVFLHGNAASRCDAMGFGIVACAAALGVSVLAFDFAGCGRAGGEFISLGVREADDVEAAIDYALARDPRRRVVLWGWSMGAAAALLYCERHSSYGVRGLILDSSFSSFRRLAFDTIAPHASSAVTSVLYWKVRRDCARLAPEADFDAMNPIGAAANVDVPAIFMTGSYDSVVPPEHTEELFKAYLGIDKRRVVFDGDHNDRRPPECFAAASALLVRSLWLDGRPSDDAAPAAGAPPPGTGSAADEAASSVLPQ